MPPNGAEKAGYNGPGWFWKPVALFMMGALLSGSLMVAREHWMLRDFITKAEAKEMVENAPDPYPEDKKLIENNFKIIFEQLDKIDNTLEIIKENIWKRR